MRYISSAYTRQAVATLTGIIDRQLVGKGPAVENAWRTVKSVVGNWMGMVMPTTAPGAGPAAGGARWISIRIMTIFSFLHELVLPSFQPKHLTFVIE
jgi:hypothetical protein